jgi:2-dehydro-3-deoxygalactonokinase
MNSSPLFLSCDWGTTSFRLQLVDAGKKITIAKVQSQQGIAATYEAWKIRGGSAVERKAFYLAVIQDHISLLQNKVVEDLKTIATVLISGMASSSLGIQELPYKDVPFSIDGNDLLIEHIKEDHDFPFDIYLCSGVRTERDVMRGEELQIIGAVNEEGDAIKKIILPGTHSKHALIEDKKLVSFKTFMTGDFFQLLSQKSLLAQSVSVVEEWSEEGQQAFEKGVRDSIGKSLLQSAFWVRTNQLFNYCSKESNYFYLSGLLIGNELQGITKNQDLLLVSDPALAKYYATAMQALGLSWTFIDAEQSVVQGHCKVFNKL